MQIQNKPTYHVLGVPLRAGSLYPGSENDAQAFRAARLLQRLEAAGLQVFDEGDVDIPSYLPHHTIPPIRNWPGPRIAWDCISERVGPYLKQPGHIPLLIGADCSVVIGTAQALMRVYGEDVHILYVDGDIDGVSPHPERCMSAAGMALWLLTQESPFRAGATVKPSQITVVGWSDDLRSPEIGLRSLSLAEARRLGPGEAARRVLQAIPASASILLHFDIDVLNKQDMPAAYFPHADGLSLTEARDLLGAILADSRIRIIEVAEYASLRDIDQSYASRLVELLAAALERSDHPAS
ncbi:MAG TPA: arginase family protein [Blastocatellia bacterium]